MPSLFKYPVKPLMSKSVRSTRGSDLQNLQRERKEREEEERELATGNFPLRESEGERGKTRREKERERERGERKTFLIPPLLATEAISVARRREERKDVAGERERKRKKKEWEREEEEKWKKREKVSREKVLPAVPWRKK